MTFKIEPFSEVPFELGEGPHYETSSNKLYFVDIVEGVAATIDKTKQVQVLLKEPNEPVTAILPVECEPNKVVLSIGTAVYLLDVASGQKTLLDKLDKQGVRFNDAKCDPRGRLWIGTMGLETAPGVLEPEQGALYVLASGSKLVQVMDKVSLSNGLSWAPDGKMFYYIDSVKRLIYAFDYEEESGQIANRRVLVDMNADAAFTASELPDGCTIDGQGNLWVAMFNGGRVVHIHGHTGKVIESIEMPTSMVTSVCFGGDNLDEMYVTSASKFLDEERKSKQPLAGYIFKITSSSGNFKGHKANFNFKL